MRRSRSTRSRIRKTNAPRRHPPLAHAAPHIRGEIMFTQVIDPLNNLTLTCLVALIPVVSLLILLAVFRWPAWLAVLAGSIITFVLALWVWRMPFDRGGRAHVYGAATGGWDVDWSTLRAM